VLTGPDNSNFRFLTLPHVVNERTMREVNKYLHLRGWQIADRWAAGAPEKVKQMEANATLIPRLMEQEQLEAETVSEARVSGRNSDVPDSEILALHEIPALP
jgi:hypothetical protein